MANHGNTWNPGRFAADRWGGGETSAAQPTASDPTTPPVAHRIDVATRGVTIDGILLEALTVAALTSALGEPRIMEPQTSTAGVVPGKSLVWDAAGVAGYARNQDVTASGEPVVKSILVRLAEDPDRDQRLGVDVAEHEPQCVFSGELTVGGQAPLAALDEGDLQAGQFAPSRKMGWFEVAFSTTDAVVEQLKDAKRQSAQQPAGRHDASGLAAIYRDAAQPFREAWISHKPPKVSSGRWVLPDTNEPLATFSGLVVKLAVVQELMYRQGSLKPRFDVHDFAADQGVRSFDPASYGGAIIPVVADWFRALPVPAELARGVERLNLDGGNEIWAQVAPYWSGEDDQFTINRITAADLAALPALRSVEDNGVFLGPRARATLRKRGIVITRGGRPVDD